MGLTYISKNCEIYLGEDSAYREDMGSLPLDCIISAEEYNALPEEQKKEYTVLVPKSRGQGPGVRGQCKPCRGRSAHLIHAQAGRLCHQDNIKTGEMPERLKGHDWKSCEGLISPPRVRIPLSPPFQLPCFPFSVFRKKILRIR